MTHDDAGRPNPNIQFTIHGTCDGFAVDVQFYGRADQLSAAIARLLACGLRPTVHSASAPSADSTSAAGAQHGTASAATAVPPRCPVHQRPMRQLPDARRGTQWKCTARDGDGYCAERA